MTEINWIFLPVLLAAFVYPLCLWISTRHVVKTDYAWYQKQVFWPSFISGLFGSTKGTGNWFFIFFDLLAYYKNKGEMFYYFVTLVGHLCYLALIPFLYYVYRYLYIQSGVSLNQPVNVMTPIRDIAIVTGILILVGYLLSSIGIYLLGKKDADFLKQLQSVGMKKSIFTKISILKHAFMRKYHLLVLISVATLIIDVLILSFIFWNFLYVYSHRGSEEFKWLMRS